MEDIKHNEKCAYLITKDLKTGFWIMRKLIDIPEEIVKPLKILAIESDTDLKNYIQNLLIAHVLKAKK